MTNPIDRIQKLMALALNNPSGEEARSAALRAVQLIAEHHVTLTAPATARPTAAPTSPSTSAISYADVIADMRRQWAQMDYEAFTRAAKARDDARNKRTW